MIPEKLLKSSAAEAMISPSFSNCANREAGVIEAFCWSPVAGAAGLESVFVSLSIETLELPFMFSLTGVAGVAEISTLSSINSSLGEGDVGLVTVGVDSAVPTILSFLAFFFLPRIGA